MLRTCSQEAYEKIHTEWDEVLPSAFLRHCRSLRTYLRLPSHHNILTQGCQNEDEERTSGLRKAWLSVRFCWSVRVGRQSFVEHEQKDGWDGSHFKRSRASNHLTRRRRTDYKTTRLCLVRIHKFQHTLQSLQFSHRLFERIAATKTLQVVQRNDD